MAMPRKKDPKKSCERCGVPLTRSVTGGRLEDMGVFLRRRFCSLTCANSRDSVKKGTLHWRARRLRKEMCEACGAPKSLQAHHVDQDLRNNDPTNVQTLCKHCHDFWHTTQKRRGLSIAGRMPPLY
jgi:hypothetical protein